MNDSTARQIKARWDRAFAILGMKRPNRAAVDPWASAWAATPPF